MLPVMLCGCRCHVLRCHLERRLSVLLINRVECANRSLSSLTADSRQRLFSSDLLVPLSELSWQRDSHKCHRVLIGFSSANQRLASTSVAANKSRKQRPRFEFGDRDKFGDLDERFSAKSARRKRPDGAALAGDDQKPVEPSDTHTSATSGTAPRGCGDYDDPASVDDSVASDALRSVECDLLPDDADDVRQAHLDLALAHVRPLGITPRTFALKCLRLIGKNKLKEALDLYFNQMLLVDRLLPDLYLFNILIAGCGRVGYTHMAFKLFYDLKSRGFWPNRYTYTSLLNACANSPTPSDTLRRVDKLRRMITAANHSLTTINYHALIKVYARSGRVQLAFAAADEMLETGHSLSTELSNFLLQACVSHKQEGFCHALLVWRRMRADRLSPDLFSYNLLLRATRDCAAGRDADSDIYRRLLTNEVTQLTAGGALRSLSRNKTTSATAQNAEHNVENSVESGQSGLPDILSPVVSAGSMLDVKMPDSALSRLALLGGWRGVLANMHADNIKPCVRTFSLLLASLPRGTKHDQELMRAAGECKVSLDTAFFNQLIRTRAVTAGFHHTKLVLSHMHELSLKPDIMTFGSVAVAVRNSAQMSEYLQLLQQHNVRCNVEILSTLLNGVTRRLDIGGVLRVLQLFVDEQVAPSHHVLHTLEQFRATLQRLLVDKERGRDVCTVASGERFQRNCRLFRMRYSSWLRQQPPPVDESETNAEQTICDQYRVTSLVDRGAALAAT